MDQIFIKDLLVRGVIGVTEAERAQPQDILINVLLYTDTREVGSSDRLEDTVNYRTIAKTIFAHTEKASRHTVEALAADIAHLCLQDPKVERVQVRVEKPGAVRFSRTVGVEIERLQEHPQDSP